jgi:hypothetical protein
MSALVRVAALGALTLATACGGSNAVIRADKANYPVSMSKGLRGEDGKLLRASQKQSVGTFALDYTSWSAVWTLVPIVNARRDISPELNAQVEKVGGDAIVGLNVKSTHCLWNYFTIVGVLPDCAHVAIRGDIVKVAASSVPAP